MGPWTPWKAIQAGDWIPELNGGFESWAEKTKGDSDFGLRIVDLLSKSEIRNPQSEFPPNFCIRNASGRCVSRISGEPTFSSPTTAEMRARVSSSFSGSGDNGTNNPFCTTRGFAGIASTLICFTGVSRWMRFQIENQEASSAILRFRTGNGSVQNADERSQGEMNFMRRQIHDRSRVQI